MFNIAFLSRWHNHAKENRYSDQLKKLPGARVTCVWDESPEVGKAWAEELSTDFEPELDALLTRGDVDGVVITSSTAAHRELIERAAAAGKHVFTEKPLALSYHEALEIEKAVKSAGIEFGIVFPRRSTAEFAYAKRLCGEGAFGEICLVRVRNGVTNAADISTDWFRPEPFGAGGAVRDLCCHNIDAACWLLGQPSSVSVTRGFKRGFPVDDTGICNLTFGCGAIAILDSTYSAPVRGNWYGLEIYGSKLTYLTDSEKVTLITADKVEKLPLSGLPAGNPLPIEQWINACTGRGENFCGIDCAVTTDRVLEAAQKAADEERTVRL